MYAAAPVAAFKHLSPFSSPLKRSIDGAEHPLPQSATTVFVCGALASPHYLDKVCKQAVANSCIWQDVCYRHRRAPPTLPPLLAACRLPSAAC